MNNNQILSQMRRDLRAITFDLWGTLFDDVYDPGFNPRFRQMRIQYFQKKLQEAGFPISEETAREAYKHARATFDALWKQQKVLRPEIGMQAMLDFVGAKVPKEIEEDLVRYFQEVVNTSTLQLYPGTAQTLRRLHEKYRIGLISDTGWTPGSILREQLRRNDILHFFDALIFSDEIGHTKPHPKLFESALQQLHVPASACLHVGDLPFTDIKGAKQVGCYTAWIYKSDFADHHEPDSQPDITLQTVSDLDKLLLSSDD